VRPVLSPILLALSLLVAAPASAEGFRLLMIESAGCAYCRVFNRDIAPIYDVAPEGRLAPLIRADLRGPLPPGVTLASRAMVTPTFILIAPDGTEAGRLIGYPGADFFWPQIERMFARAGVTADTPSGAAAGASAGGG
jgi:hypothetical protein